MNKSMSAARYGVGALLVAAMVAIAPAGANAASPAGHRPAPTVTLADDAPPPPPPPPPVPVTRNVPCTDAIRYLPFDYSAFTGGWRVYEYYSFSYLSSSPTLDVSDERAVVNDTDAPVSATFTAQKSHTFTVEVSASAQAKLGALITATVTSRFAWSWTTLVGVSATAMVPPGQTVRAQYGVNAYWLTSSDRTVRWSFRGGTISLPFEERCTETTGEVTRNIPTREEAWRIYVERPSPF
jgi:hypothetical protein